MTETAIPTEPTEEELSEQAQVRLGKRDRLIGSGAGAYPVSLPITHTIPDVRAQFPNLEAARINKANPVSEATRLARSTARWNLEDSST